MALIRRMGIDPKRSLGQNFLLDPGHLDEIVAAADLQPDDTVLEIGPGPGTLTTRLAAAAGTVVAVELDDRLIDPLRAEFADRPHVQIVHGDILKLSPPTLFAGPTPRYKVVANLPYYITSAVLRHVLEAVPPPTLAVVLVQEEVAERICAQPGDLSILAVSIQVYAEPKLVHRIPAGAFYPQPKVDSAVLRLAVRPEPAVTRVPLDRYFAVVRAGFSQKRKQLANSLSGGLRLAKPMVADALKTAGVDPARRAETVDLAEWERICLSLDGTGG